MIDRLIEACKKLAEKEPGKWELTDVPVFGDVLRKWVDGRFKPYLLKALTSDEVDEIAAELGMEVEDGLASFSNGRLVLIQDMNGGGVLDRILHGLTCTKREARIEGLIRAIEIYLAMSGRKEGVK